MQSYNVFNTFSGMIIFLKACLHFFLIWRIGNVRLLQRGTYVRQSLLSSTVLYPVWERSDVFVLVIFLSAFLCVFQCFCTEMCEVGPWNK